MITLIMAHPDNFIVLTRIDVFTHNLVPHLWILNTQSKKDVFVFFDIHISHLSLAENNSS